MLLVMNVQYKPSNNYLENFIVSDVIFLTIDVTGHVDDASQTIIGLEEISEKIIGDDSTHKIGSGRHNGPNNSTVDHI